MTIRVKKSYNRDFYTFERLLKKHLSDKVIEDDFANKLYGSLCNIIWYNKSTEDIYSCSWRYAGELVGDMRCKGEDYLDFYCNGKEGSIDSEVCKELMKLGYEPLEYNKISRLQENDFK